MNGKAEIGQTIVGKYRLERELGAGGMGAVWLATQLMVDRPVAVKLLHPAFIEQEELQKRFEVEAKAIGKLNHPNCITLYDFGYSDDLGAFYTVIEYIDGISLDKLLGTQMTVAYIANLMRQIAVALDHAHFHGILHRDLKPENVMLSTLTDGAEIIKVLDFGIARIVKGQFEEPNDESQRITKAGEVFGTPAYMSPEQARSIRQLTPAADLYSVGVMFYEMLSGELPFFANSAFDLLMLHVTKPVPPLRRSDVPEAVKEIIYKLLEKDPSKRYQSGKELAYAIDQLDMSGVFSLEDEPTQVDRIITLPMGSATTGEKTAPNLRAQQLPAGNFTSAESTTGKIETFDYADTDPSIDVPRTRPNMGTWSRLRPQTAEGRRRTLIALAVAFFGLVIASGVLYVTTRTQDSEPTIGKIVAPIEPTKSVEKEVAQVKVAGNDENKALIEEKPIEIVPTKKPVRKRPEKKLRKKKSRKKTHSKPKKKTEKIEIVPAKESQRPKKEVEKISLDPVPKIGMD